MDKIKETYQDTQEWNQQIVEQFNAAVNANPRLKDLRDFVEQNAFGFGERAFYQMWNLIIDTMPKKFSFLEIGVFRGQTLALIRELANQKGKQVNIVGVTPLDDTDGHWQSDYENDIKFLHTMFELEQPVIVKGLSTEPAIIDFIQKDKFDIVYIDGGHTYDVITSDLQAYAHLAKKWLVIDDCANKFNMPFGFFKGIEPVSRAVDEYLPPFTENPNFEYYFNIVHNRIWKRKNAITTN